MPAVIPRRAAISTQRLTLQPSCGGYAERAFATRSDWYVARMLSAAEYPPSLENVSSWFAQHSREWEEGKAFRFSICLDGTMIGLVDLDNPMGGKATLGYWLDREAWGQGFATEAASAVVQFGFSELGLKTIKAGHAADNMASGRILTRLGFAFLGTSELFSKPRGLTITQWRYHLTRS